MMKILPTMILTRFERGIFFVIKFANYIHLVSVHFGKVQITEKAPYRFEPASSGLHRVEFGHDKDSLFWGDFLFFEKKIV